MDMTQIVTEMRETAKRNPHNQDRHFIMPEVCARFVEIDGKQYQLGFTYNIWDHMPAKCWQLSIQMVDQSPVKDAVAKMVADAFLGTGYDEFTDKMPVEIRFIRQFMKRA